MLRQQRFGCSSQHSMLKKFPSSQPTRRRCSYGDQRFVSGLSSWSNVLFFGLLCYTIIPNGVTSFTPPANCTSVSFKINETKMHNISCQGVNLTSVPSDNKEGGDVYKLDLSFNPITSIKASDFQFFTNLVVLDLSNTELSSIPFDTFDNLTNLRHLSLAANNLSTVLDAEIFLDSPLDFLNISNCSLDALDKTIFNNLIELRQLDASYNSIIRLERDLFKKTIHVETIDLSHNEISYVDNNFLNDAQSMTNLSVTFLDLSHNQITSLMNDVFYDNPLLVTLNLSNNKLTTLQSDLFRKTPDLLYLNVSHNEITSLPNHIFNDIPKVEYLDLSYNNFTTIQSTLFSGLSNKSRIIDVSNNLYSCMCTEKELLYTLLYAGSLISVEETKCTDTLDNREHIYTDYNSAACSGALGSTCNFTSNCMVRNSVCDMTTHACVCNSLFYDDNGVGESMGLCKNKVELGQACTMPTMCRDIQAECNASNLCDCKANYYDNDTTAVIGGSCLPQLSLYSSCYMTSQCGTSDSECLNGFCNCSAGFYDFANDGTCLGADKFFSCYGTGSSEQDEIVFATPATTTTNNKTCEEHCFRRNERYYVYTGGVCLCGNIKSTSTIKCCPKVSDSCDGNSYVGVASSLASAGINITHVPKLYYGVSHTFSFTTTLAIIDEVRVEFGDSDSVTVAASSASVSHTYSYAGRFWLSVYGCVQAENVCEKVSVPIGVQVPQENLTTYITGVSKADVSSGLTNVYATIPMGYNFEFYWSKEYNGVVTKKEGCQSGWTAHRTTCIKLVTGPADFTSASTACAADGGKLLKIDHTSEIPEIVTVLSASSTSFLLGAQRSGGLWTWTSDSSKTVFKDDDLTVATNGDCVKIDGATSKLTSASCTTAASYACMTDPVSCPYGGKLMPNDYCYLLVNEFKTYQSANEHCQVEYGGWLANITDSETHSNITALLTADSVSEAWFGLNDTIHEGYYMWADGTAFNFYRPHYLPVTSLVDNNGDCFVTTNLKTWSELDCISQRRFVCQYSTHIDHITVPTYVNGVPSIGIPAGNNLHRLVATSSFPVGTATGYKIKIFPGMLFSRTGSIRYWLFRTKTITPGMSYDVSLQHYKPECTSGSLIQPGCASTKFSTCSSGTHTCSPSTVCNSDQQFCYLSNTCKAVNESCTCNSESGNANAVTSCTTTGTTPSYKLVGQTTVTVTSSGEFISPAGDISVEELDIIGFQYPDGLNVIECQDVPSGANQQTTYEASADHWLTHQELFPSSSTTASETCYLQAIYTVDHKEYLTSNLAYASSVGSYNLGVTIIEGISRQLSLQLEESVGDISWVYPAISEPNTTVDSFGTIYTEWNSVKDLTMRVERGTDLASQWSIDGVDSTVSFSNTCTATIQAAMSTACNASLYWPDKPYAYLALNSSSIGVKTISIMIYNDLGSTTNTLQIKTEKVISGVTFRLSTYSRIPNNVAIGKESQFTTTVADGTGLSYSYTINGTAIPAPTSNSSVFYTFTTLGTYSIDVTVSNILGSQTETVIVEVKQAAEFTNCKFVNSDPSVAAIGIELSLQVQCEVTTGANVSTVWTLSDRSTNITDGVSKISSTPYTWLQSVTFASLQTGVVVTAYIMDPFEQVSVTLSVNVYNAVSDVSLTLNTSHVFTDEDILFQASVPASGNFGAVEYTFVFGDGNTIINNNGIAVHKYSTPGNYTMTATASNGPSNHTTTTYVAVYEAVTGLTVATNGPKEVIDPITITASIVSGNFLSYNFQCSEFNVTLSSPSYAFTFSVATDYTVTVKAFNELSSESATVTAYIMNSDDIRILDFTVDGQTNVGCFETNVAKQFEVEVIHYDKPLIIYHWDFDNGILFSDNQVVKSQAFSVPQNYNVTVIAEYSVLPAVAIAWKSVCVQERITSPTISLTSPVALPASGSITETVSVTLGTGSDVNYEWSTNATAVGSTTDPNFSVMFTAETFYSITVNVSNEINSVVTTKLIQVIEVIDGLSIVCASCIEQSGDLYVRKNEMNTFSINSTSGTGVTYSWDFGESTVDNGETVAQNYTALGTYTITVTATNTVLAPVVIIKTVYVQDDISSVTLTKYGSDWITSSGVYNLDIMKVGLFKAIVLPAGMDLEYEWTFEDGLSPETTNSDIVYHTYNSTGKKNVTVTVKNAFSSVTANRFEFYVIEKLVDYTLTENNTILVSENHTCLINTVYVYKITSPQTVPGTVTYNYNVRKSGILVFSENKETFSYTYSNVSSDWVLTAFIINQLGTIQSSEIKVNVVKPLAGPYITSSVADGNITLGSSITLTGGVSQGQQPKFNYYYAVAPSGEYIPPSSVVDNQVTIFPTQVGEFIVTLEVYNSVSNSVYVNYTFNVMIGVSGVSIDVQPPYPNAIIVGNTLFFTAVVQQGTGLSYNWTAELTGTHSMVVKTGNYISFDVPFTSQAIYNITLTVVNYASSETSFIEIYSLYEVPTFIITQTGATYNPSDDLYALETNSEAEFSHSLTDTTFVDLVWSRDGITEVTTETYTHNFTSVGDYVVALNATNRINKQYESIDVVVQDPVEDLLVSPCNSTFVLNTTITMSASVTGTDVYVLWSREQMVDNTQHALTTVFINDKPGVYSVKVTAMNYVSSQVAQCFITLQGVINNLVVTKSTYQYVGYPVTFGVSGDYIDPATFVWVFSDGTTKTTSVPSVDHTFAAKGNYTITVTVSNDVSTKTVSHTFGVEELKCSVPTLTVDGSTERTVRRSRGFELSANVVVGDCNDYTSKHEWLVFSATSCAHPLGNAITLDDISTNTPTLQIPKNTLAFGTYCVQFKHSYENTPVTHNVTFNVTVVKSNLKALLEGSDYRMTSSGSTLTLNASRSTDPDEDSGTVMQYVWSCTQISGTSTGTCSHINALAASEIQLTNLVLNVNDEFRVKVTVYATDRENDTAEQTIMVVGSAVPIFHLTCVSCEAHGHYGFVNTKGVSIESDCVSGCTTTSTYQWTIIDTATSAVLTIDTSQTKTGANGKNFVLKSSQLQENKNYTFKLEVTENGEVGVSEMTLTTTSKPSMGTCTVDPYINVVPFEDLPNVTCVGVTDTDHLTSIYYKILIGPSQTYGQTYIAYYGTKASNNIFVVPSIDGNVSLSIYVENDFGSVNFLQQRTIRFSEPTLAAGTTKLDYLISKMVVQMKTIAKKNSPSEILQYCLAVLNYLNRLSEASIGNISQRMALRDVIIRSLAGLHVNSLQSIQQMSSAMELVTEYTNELSTPTLDKVVTLIDSLKDKLQDVVQKGMDQEEIRPNALFGAINKVQSALKWSANSSSSVVSSNATVLAMFYPVEDYTLSISSGLTTAVYSSESARLLAMTQKTMDFSIQLLIVSLTAQVAGEDHISLTFNDGSSLLARHVATDKASDKLELNGMLVSLSDEVLTHVGYNQPTVFQYAMVNQENPYDFNNSTDVNTKIVTFAYHDPAGNHLPIENLPESSRVKIYIFSESIASYPVNVTGLPYSANYNPLTQIKYSTHNLKPSKTYRVNFSPPTDEAMSMHIQIRANYSATSNGNLTATLYKNNQAKNYELTINSSLMNDPHTDHRKYTFFLNPGDVSTTDRIYVKLKSSESMNISIGIYYPQCKYYDTVDQQWSSTGCEPNDESIPSVITCQCNHMTSFGGNLFISPDQLDFTDLSEVDFASNPVAIITCSVILFMYIVLVLAFKRLDIMDVKRISLIPLCGKDGSFKYEVTVVTGRLPRAGTTAHVGIRLIGEYGKSVRQHISKPGAFQRNCSDTFFVAYDVNLGDLRKIQIWHDNSGTSPSWYLSHVIVNDLQTDQKYYFLANSWLTLEDENGSIQKEIKVAGAHEMTRFTHRMKTAAFNALADKHLWLSLFNRPAQSRFTRTQRVTCCFTILYVFVGVNAMWYGLLKKDNTEIGFGDFGWEEFVLALVSNVMVLPIMLGLVFLFKKSRSKPDFLDNVHKPQTAQTLEIENLCGNSQGGSFESDNTGAVPYDLERESTIDSVPHTALGLHRSRHVAKTHRENTDDSFCQPKRPSVAVTQASSRSPLWNEDGIMKWPDSVPTYEDGADSRPSTGSTMASVPAIKQPPKAGGSTPGAARKTRKGDAGQLLEELDKLEQDLKETESNSGRSGSNRRSSTTLRRPTMHKSNWGSLEDILNSDDESVADTTAKLRKRGSTTSQSTMRKFNPRADPRIQGNGSDWPKSRESMTSAGPRGITAGLRPGYYSEMTMESRDLHIPIHKEKCSLPPWCIYIAYVLCFLLSVFSIIIVILYCFKFGYNESIEWLLALILSLILSFLIIEPLKALLIAVYVVAMFKNVEQDEDDDCIDIKPTFDHSNEKIKDVKFKPISGFALLQAKEEGRKIHRMKILIRQFIAYIFYLWLIMAIVYINFRYDSYLMTKHVEHDFIAPTTTGHLNFTNITSTDEFWDWTENVFSGSLYKENYTEEEHAFLLGAPRMRLIRGLTAYCEASTSASKLGAASLTQRTCNGEGTYTEDMQDYSEGWNDSNSNYSWRYSTAAELGSTHKIGHVATYGGGGYAQVLGTSLAEADTILSHLKDKNWVDLQTRAVIFEFAMYSSGSDMTSMVALLAEFPLTGGVITSYEIQSQRLLWFSEQSVDPLMILEVILFFVIIYSVVHIALQIREHGKGFFKDGWNWYEMLTTLMALVSVGMYIGCVVEATNTFNRLLQDLTEFTNFERVMYVHVGMRYLHAWLLFLLMLKVVKQLRFIKFMYVYEQTLSKAFGHLVGSGLIYVILLLIYAQVGYLMYGRIVDGFESVGHSITTLVVMIRGSFDFWPMLDHHPVFSHFYVYSYYAIAYGIFTALVISILTSTYRIVKSQMYFTSTLEMQDYEMIEFMLKRFKLWAGLQKPKPAFRRVRFPGLPSISSRSSSSYSNRSSASLQSAQSLTGPQFSEVQLSSMLTRLQPTWQAVLKRMDKIVALDEEEEKLVKDTENEMKDLNWKCRINELERQHKELLSWKNQSGASSSKPPAGDAKQRQSILKRLSTRKDNQERNAPATVSGAPSRTAVSTPADDGKSGKGAQGRRPLSDQGARVEPSTSNRRSSSNEKSKIQTFLKSIKPSKSAWNK